MSPSHESRSFVHKAFDDEACRNYLVHWLHSRRDTESSDSQGGWLAQFRTDSAFWRLAGSHVATQLKALLQTTVSLAWRLNRDRPTRSPAQYAAWLNQAAPLQAGSPPTSSDAMQRLFENALQSDTPLVRALVARALAGGLEVARLPKSQSTPLMRLVQSDLRGYQDLLVPPGSKAPATDCQYVFAADRRESWQRCNEVIAEIQIAIAESQRMAAHPQMSMPTAVVRQQRSECVAAFDEFQNFMALATGGWPVPRPELNRLSARSIQLLSACSTPTHFQQVYGTGRLDDWIKTVRSFEQECSLPLPPPHGEQPGADSGSLVHFKPSGETWAITLIEIAGELSQSSDERARNFSKRLEAILASEASEKLDKASEDVGRNLLSCLIYLDELIRSDQSRWIGLSRRTLRQVIEEQSRFLVLDSELIGRAIPEVASLVVAVGYIDTMRIAPGRVGAVQQPGYALTSGNGVRELLCPAKVLLARRPDQ